MTHGRSFVRQFAAVCLGVFGDRGHSRPGDLWLLGYHRLYCGSALETTAYDVRPAN
jgi:hypothetical protein